MWKELSDRGISHYAQEIENRKPHLTIADYSELNNEAEYCEQFVRYYESASKMSLGFGALGTFIDSGALFLSPNPTKKLLDFHFDHHRHFHAYSSFSNPVYHPGQWIPHCMIANRLDDVKLSEALRFATKSLTAIEAEVQEVSLIKIIHDENKKTIRTLASQSLA
ncbi:2'-5' RNA ligase family protein [Saccharibacillus endophyticus]|uniref:2'-5' RNA ligase family protein n=1 Tax=Saccharibacillus endophyticus TaxID=2060666 RepID=UPI001665F285|nr:2'-5' RNA ligase family protein [Saccharibacillus endophyticus]